MEPQSRWEAVCQSKLPEAVSRHTPDLQESLPYGRLTGLSRCASVINVGAGESTLCDDLPSAGHGCVTAINSSEKALEVTRTRVSELAIRVTWLVAEVLKAQRPAKACDVWHDRAVRHVLIDATQRQADIAQVVRVLAGCSA